MQENWETSNGLVQATSPDSEELDWGISALFSTWHPSCPLAQFSQGFQASVVWSLLKKFLCKALPFLPEQKYTLPFCNDLWRSLNMKGLSIFFRCLASSHVTDMYTRIMTAYSRFKPYSALFTALLCNSYSHYTTVKKKSFLLLCSSLCLLLHRSQVFRQICMWKALGLFNSSYLFGSFSDFSLDKLSRTALSCKLSFCYTRLKWAQGHQKLPRYQEITKEKWKSRQTCVDHMTLFSLGVITTKKLVVFKGTGKSSWP